MAKMANLARLICLGLIVAAIYPAVGPFIHGQASWGQTIDIIASDNVVKLLVVAAVLGLVASVFNNKKLRTGIMVGAIALGVLSVQGVIPFHPVQTAAKAYSIVSEGSAAAKQCGYSLGVEGTGSNLRAVLRDPTAAGQVIGYVTRAADGTIKKVVGSDGQEINWKCA